MEAIAQKQGRVLVTCQKPGEVVGKLSLVVYITGKTWGLEILRDNLPIECVNDLEMDIQYKKREIPITKATSYCRSKLCDNFRCPYCTGESLD